VAFLAGQYSRWSGLSVREWTQTNANGISIPGTWRSRR